MTLKECVLIALQQAYDLQISAMSRVVAESNARAATGAYDPNFTASASFSDTTSPAGFDTMTGVFRQSQSENISASAGISGLLPSGGSYTVGASISDTEGTSGPFPFSNATANGPFIEIRQPLLENFLIDDVRLNIEVSRQNLQVSIHDFDLALQTTVNRVEEAYYDLVASRENVRVQETALALAEELWRDNQQRVLLGASAPLEEAEARAQAATSRASLLNAQRFVRTAENNLKAIMVDDYAQWRQVSIVPQNQLSDGPTALDFNSSWTMAQLGRPDLLALQVQVDQQQVILKRRGNELLPQLDLTASAGLSGSAFELSQAYEQIRDGDSPFYRLGLSLALPLTNRREREGHRAAAAQAQQVQLRFRQFRQSIMIQIDEAISQVKTNFERVGATREARDFAEQALTNERAKLARGASTNFVVLQLQRNLTAARSDEIQSLTDYNKSLVRLRYVEGSNLENYQINVTEGK